MEKLYELYEKIKRQLDRIDFEALWPGFHPFPFALYDRTHAILNGKLMDCPDDFHGNTAIDFQGRLTAIWRIDTELPKDDIRVASQLVHEMFHAFQLEQKERRFPNDLLLAGAELSPEYLALKAEECRFLSAPGGLPRFQALREMRRTLNGSCTQEEFQTETIEGMAQYIELCALEQLSADREQSAGGKHLLATPERELTALAECAGRLQDPKVLLDVRRCAYDSGCLLMFAARRLGISVFHAIGDESRSLYDLLALKLPQADCPPPLNLSREALAPWSRILSEQAAQREALIRAFLQSPHTTTTGSFRICGYDPMNLWRRGDTLYSTSFLCLLNQDGNTVTLTGRALLQMRCGSPDIAEAYSTMPPGT